MSQTKILEFLDQVEYLTRPQVARLFYGVRRDGQAATARKAKPSKDSFREYPLEPGYDSAKWILTAMCRKKVIVRGKERKLLVQRKSKNKANPDIFYRPGARIRNNDDAIYGHDMAVVVSAVLLYLTGQLVAFQRFWDDEQYAYYGTQWNLWPDGLFALKPKPDHSIFEETDFGTEWEKGQIAEKCQAYVNYANAHPGERFTVIFPTKGAYGETDEQRIEKLLKVFATFGRQNMFLTCNLSDFVGDLKRMDGQPLAPIFRSPWRHASNPLNPDAISLLDVS